MLLLGRMHLMCDVVFVLLGKWFGRQIGDGSSVRVWHDRWLPSPSTFQISSPRPSNYDIFLVQELITSEAKWDLPQLDSLLFTKEVDLICTIPLSKRKVDDKLVWHYDKRGLFTVKNAYHVTRLWTIPISLISSSSTSSTPYYVLWEKLRCTLIPPKAKMMAWRIFSNIIPTGLNLIQKRIHIDPSCIMCGAGP